MIFTNITFKHTNIATDERLDNLVEQKLVSLEKHIDANTEVKTEVEFEKIPSHRSGPICRIEINVWVDGTLYRAESTEETFEAAIDVVRNDLDQEMRRAQSKRHSLLRRGSRKIKEMMRWG
ncbi:MAG TPA: ribosome-associated translation inhibitor RaiA [Candidatus Paceibacterota bacterium]|nr:ribosome-associated translation inhibitor RaiA [Candidatus Paceibacterota bacterium]HMO83102.1 ribosome-associated translation inhibitor RaiA [Candidatus Paceibacterota bacterium]